VRLLWAGIASFLLLLAPAGGWAQSAPEECGPDGRGGLIPQDTLLHVTNRGVTRIFANINGRRFKLVTDPAEARQSDNAFPIPIEGARSINIAALMEPADNCYAFRLQGAPGTEADLFIANVPLAGQPIAYAIDGLQELPETFDLKGAPNPFRTRVNLTYTIPENRTTGLEAHLAVYDARGRLVRTLVRERRFPGTFTETWNATDRSGAPVASGVYFVRLIAGERQETIGVALVR